MPNIILITKGTREQVMVQPDSYYHLHDILTRHNLIKFNRPLSKGTWLRMTKDQYDKVLQGLIVTSNYLECHMYLAPETVKPIIEVPVCSTCGQELPDAD